MEEKLLSIEEVARFLKLSEDAVGELVEKGDLPAYKIGGILLRFKKQQVESYRQKRDSAFIIEKASMIFGRTPGKIVPREHNRQLNTDRECLWIDRKNISGSNSVKYTFLERLEDFLYYNDFYILSLILLILIVLAVFGL